MTAFAPSAPTATVSVSDVNADAAIPLPGAPVLLLQNDGAKTCFVMVGSPAQVATTAAFPILSGGVLAINPGASTHIAAICGATDTTTLYATSGTGDITGGD